VPRYWFYLQLVIVVGVLMSAVIGAIKL